MGDLVQVNSLIGIDVCTVIDMYFVVRVATRSGIIFPLKTRYICKTNGAYRCSPIVMG